MTRDWQPQWSDRLEAYAWHLLEAIEEYTVWHWEKFKCSPEDIRALSQWQEKTYAPRPMIICPRCGESRRTSNSSADPLLPCRLCRVQLLPLVPTVYRRRGVAVAEGYHKAWAIERAKALLAERALQRARVRRSKAKDPERTKRERRDGMRALRARRRAVVAVA